VTSVVCLQHVQEALAFICDGTHNSRASLTRTPVWISTLLDDMPHIRWDLIRKYLVRQGPSLMHFQSYTAVISNTVLFETVLLTCLKDARDIGYVPL